MTAAMSYLLSALHSAVRPLRTRMRSEHGLEAIEYALIAALIAVAVIAAVTLLNPNLSNAFNTIGARVNDAANLINPN
jgi:pilus assembly protein Flp/PilA